VALDVSTPERAPAPVARGIDLLTAEPDLCAAIPAEDVALARRLLVASGLVLERGPWTPDPGPDGDSLLGYIVLEGVLAHEVTLAGSVSMQLAGPGDIVDPFGARGVDGPAEHRWQVLEDASLARLGTRFVAATRKWPLLGVALHRRRSEQATRASVLTALSQLGRVELRILALLWLLVDRWGAVTPDGIVVQLRLKHETLGQLVGARRPTITLALKELTRAGHVTRREDGLLLLAFESRRTLADPGA
jgi:hypothetical protein